MNMVADIALVADGWLETLRAYPRWMVLGGAALVLGAVVLVVAKSLKWSLYLGLLGVFGVLMAGLAWWLSE
jgi:hypothetical protein